MSFQAEGNDKGRVKRLNHHCDEQTYYFNYSEEEKREVMRSILLEYVYKKVQGQTIRRGRIVYIGIRTRQADTAFLVRQQLTQRGIGMFLANADRPRSAEIWVKYRRSWGIYGIRNNGKVRPDTTLSLCFPELLKTPYISVYLHHNQ